jgi:hypothetical protein
MVLVVSAGNVVAHMQEKRRSAPIKVESSDESEGGGEAEASKGWKRGWEAQADGGEAEASRGWKRWGAQPVGGEAEASRGWKRGWEAQAATQAKVGESRLPFKKLSRKLEKVENKAEVA